MNTISKTIVITTLALIASGCSTYSANRYSTSVDNVVALRALNGTKINVGNFSSSGKSQTEIMCRGVGPIKTPDGETFENFIRKALIDELKISEIYSDTAQISLTGNLDAVDFSSNSGTWDLSLTIASSNGEALSVSEKYSFTTSFYGETACNQTAQALMPAVQNLIGKIVRNNEFKKLTQ